MPILTILYLFASAFKQGPIRGWVGQRNFWTPLIFVAVGFLVTLWRHWAASIIFWSNSLLSYVDLLEIFRKFAELTPMVVLMDFNGQIFLGLMTSVKDKYKWWVRRRLTLLSFRISFHTPACCAVLVIGVVYGSLFTISFCQSTRSRTSLPFLMHAFGGYAFGSKLMYVLIKWR